MKKIFVMFVFFSFLVPCVYGKGFNFKITDEVSFDDNIYLTKSDKVSSIINSIHGLARYLTKIPSTSFNFDTSVDVGYNSYVEDPSRNNNWFAGLGLNLKNRFFELREKFTYTTDPANRSIDERTERINNDVYLGFTTSKEKKLGFGIYGRDVLDYYLKEYFEGLNRNKIMGGAKIFYNFTPTKSLYAGYQYTNIKYDKNEVNNSTGNSYFLGVEGNISAKLTGVAQVSYDDRKYEKKYDQSPESGHVLGYLANITYAPYRSTIFTLEGTREMEETSSGYNRYYISSTVYLKFKQIVFQKWTVGCTTGYENMDFPIEYENGLHRTDEYFTVIPSLDYKFNDYFSAGIWYQYRSKISNHEFAEYLNNRTGLKLSLMF